MGIFNDSAYIYNIYISLSNISPTYPQLIRSQRRIGARQLRRDVLQEALEVAAFLCRQVDKVDIGGTRYITGMESGYMKHKPYVYIYNRLS